MSIYNSLTKKRIVDFPLETRLQAYNKALELRKKNLSVVQIWKVLKQKGLEIKYETLRTWINGIRKPQKKLNTIKKIDKKLPYLIGLVIGDGCFYKVMKKGSYMQGRIILGVKEKELAEKFAYLSSYILGKETDYKVRWSKNQQVHIVEFCSKHLVELLSKPFYELKKIIELSQLNFLKGIFDAEGCISMKNQNNRLYLRLFLTNSNLKLIKYIKYLLEEFNIKSTIQKNTSAGKIKIINNIQTATRKKCYNLSIEYIEGVRNFAKSINFTIKRKRKRLETLINLINKYGNHITFKKWNIIKLKL